MQGPRVFNPRSNARGGRISTLMCGMFLVEPEIRKHSGIALTALSPRAPSGDETPSEGSDVPAAPTFVRCRALGTGRIWGDPPSGLRPLFRRPSIELARSHPPRCSKNVAPIRRVLNDLGQLLAKAGHVWPNSDQSWSALATRGQSWWQSWGERWGGTAVVRPKRLQRLASIGQSWSN